MPELNHKAEGRPATLFGLPGFEDLRSFTGTENYWTSIITYKGRQLSYTDGVKYVASKAEAFWLIDMALLHAVEIYGRAGETGMQTHSLLVGRLDVNPDDTAVFKMLDGNGKVLARQDIPFTDFPALSQVIWVKEGIAMLPSEY